MANPTGTFDLPTRDVLTARYLRNYRVRNSAADVGKDTLPYADALSHTDSVIPIYANAQAVYQAPNLVGASTARLDEIGEAEGVVRPAKGSAGGYVTLEASTGGATIYANDELYYRPTQVRYKVVATKLYADEEELGIVSIDTGPPTNLAAGSELTWSSPRPGCKPTCVVTEQADGSGLSGGREAASDEEYAALIVDNRTNPASAGNDAAYTKAVESTPALQVEKCFTYPCIRGPGTTGIAFTMKPATAGASRLPNATQIAQVAANLEATFPADDGIFAVTLLAQDVDVALQVTWTRRAVGYVDAVPWPEYETTPVAVDGAVTPTPTTFRVTTSVSTTNPQVGQTIGIWNAATGKFSRKQILSIVTVIDHFSWTLTCDTTNGASDASYTPVAGQNASPWSDSLNLIAAKVIAYFSGLGPGEQVASFSDPGSRMRRQPENPGAWPSQIRNRIVDNIFDVAGVADASLLSPAVPLSSTVGSPGATAYLLSLADLAIFAS